MRQRSTTVSIVPQIKLSTAFTTQNERNDISAPTSEMRWGLKLEYRINSGNSFQIIYANGRKGNISPLARQLIDMFRCCLFGATRRVCNARSATYKLLHQLRISCIVGAEERHIIARGRSVVIGNTDPQNLQQD